MASRQKSAQAGAKNGNANIARLQPTRSVAAIRNGIKSGRDFAEVMAGVMADLLDGRLDPRTANSVCSAGGQILKVVELQMKLSTQKNKSGALPLQLVA